MWFRACAVTALLACACVESDFPQGLACGEDDRCPPDQQCVGGHCFASAPDGGGGEGGCDPFEQACGGDQACYVRPPDEGGPTCAAAGDGTMHDECDADDDCAAGYSCADTPLGDQCSAYCHAGSDDDCSGLDVCQQLGGGGIGQCVFGGCDALAQDCGPSEGCYLDENIDLGVCTMEPGSLPQGAVCDGPFDCEKGFHCLGCGGERRCSRYCDASAGDSDCDDLATQCVPVDGDLGACTSC